LRPLRSCDTAPPFFRTPGRFSEISPAAHHPVRSCHVDFEIGRTNSYRFLKFFNPPTDARSRMRDKMAHIPWE